MERPPLLNCEAAEGAAPPGSQLWPTPYLNEGDAARRVHRVGRVVEHSVPVQRPQSHVGQEEKGHDDEPGELQQPLLLAPHLSGKQACESAAVGKLASPDRSLFGAEATFTVAGGTDSRRCDAPTAASAAARGSEPQRFRPAGQG